MRLVGKNIHFKHLLTSVNLANFYNVALPKLQYGIITNSVDLQNISNWTQGDDIENKSSTDVIDSNQTKKCMKRKFNEEDEENIDK